MSRQEVKEDWGGGDRDSCPPPPVSIPCYTYTQSGLKEAGGALNKTAFIWLVSRAITLYKA